MVPDSVTIHKQCQLIQEDKNEQSCSFATLSRIRLFSVKNVFTQGKSELPPRILGIFRALSRGS